VSPGALRRRTVTTLLTAGLIAQIALIAIALLSNADGSDHRTISTPHVEVPAGSIPLSAESGQPIAQAYADRWSTNADMIAVTMRLDWPADASAIRAGELPESGWLIYVFSDGEKTESIYLDRGTGFLLANAESEFGGGDWSALDYRTYPRRSTIAAAAADITSGYTYRSACPDSRTTALVTATSVTDVDGSSRPVWTVTYGDSRFSGTYDVLVQMDALSGNVIKREVRDRAC
jgi:hypothetical protein